ADRRSGDARPEGSRLSRQPHLRHAGAAGPHHRRQRSAVSAPAQCGNDLRAQFRRADPAVARIDHGRESGAGGGVMKNQLRRRAYSIALIIGFFLFWEFACVAFGIKDIVLPRPSQIVVTLIDRIPAIWPHAVQTLYTTMVGFALGIFFGGLICVVIGSSGLAYDTAYPL